MKSEKIDFVFLASLDTETKFILFVQKVKQNSFNVY